MTQDKVRYPGVGCLVEFMQGNSPTLGIVTEEQGGKLRVYTQNKRETPMPASRLLPWCGPQRGANLSRTSMEAALEECRAQREALLAGIDVLELWSCVQGEAERASADSLAGLLWEEPTVHHEAALGRALLACKTHFRFAPPDFEIFPEAVVQARLVEAKALRLREQVASAGAEFFRQLWEFFTGKRPTAPVLHDATGEMEERLKGLLLQRIADPETSEDEALWKLLVKGLPEYPHHALGLATAWGLVPPHYNFWLDRAGFAKGQAWAEPFAQVRTALREAVATQLASLPQEPFARSCGQGQLPLMATDPSTTKDRDDAFAVEALPDGSFQLFIAIACPALVWPFGSAFDKAILRRASSIYLPEGDEHMLPEDAGWQLFSLDAGKERPALVLQTRINAQGEATGTQVSVARVTCTANLPLHVAEEGLSVAVQALGPDPMAQEQSHEALPWGAELFLTEEEQGCASAPAACLAEGHPTQPLLESLTAALALSRVLQARRVAQGAVITERPMPDVTLAGEGSDVTVAFSDEPQTPLAHTVVGEIMVFANAALAGWARDKGIALLFRSQDVGIPKEYAGVWSRPEDIARVVRGLPSAGLSTVPRKHAGLGLEVYASCTAPMRRYIDLVNQGQLVHAVQHGTPLFTQEVLQEMQPLIGACAEAVGQVQRFRPRYWKLLYFAQQGDKKWWPAVVTEENPAFVSVTVPFAQLFVRGRTALFNEKVAPGQALEVRLGKVNPLLNEIQILEVREL